MRLCPRRLCACRCMKLAPQRMRRPGRFAREAVPRASSAGGASAGAWSQGFVPCWVSRSCPMSCPPCACRARHTSTLNPCSAETIFMSTMHQHVVRKSFVSRVIWHCRLTLPKAAGTSRMAGARDAEELSAQRLLRREKNKRVRRSSARVGRGLAGDAVLGPPLAARSTGGAEVRAGSVAVADVVAGTCAVELQRGVVCASGFQGTTRRTLAATTSASAGSPPVLLCQRPLLFCGEPRIREARGPVCVASE